MWNRMKCMALATAALVLGTAQPGSAQALPDTAGLASAVGAFLVETVVPEVGRRNRLEVGEPGTAFDSAVAVILRAAPEAGLPPRRGHRNWVATRRLAFRGDTAVVLVEQGTSWPAPVNDPYSLTLYFNQDNFFFVREPAGWRYVRRQFHSHADGGAVRG